MKRRKKKASEKEMPEKKSNTDSELPNALEQPSQALAKRIGNAAADLNYISETDAPIKLFVGEKASSVTAAELLKQTAAPSDAVVEERDFADFFARLTRLEDWFGAEETANAARFKDLENVLKNNVRDLHVFKVGKIELSIYAVGLDAEDTLIGIKTKAVET